MSKHHKFVIEQEEVIISNGDAQDNNYLSCPIHVTCKDTMPTHSNGCYKMIKASPDIVDKINSHYCVILNEENNEYCEVIVLNDESLAFNEIKITNYLKTHLLKTDDKIKEPVVLTICKEKSVSFHEYTVQKLGDIFDDNVLVPVDFNFDAFKEYSLIEVVNAQTDDSIFVKSNHIKPDPSLKSGTIRLNRKQRMILRDDLPTSITEEQLNSINKFIADVLKNNNEDSLSGFSDKEKTVINRLRNNIVKIEENFNKAYINYNKGKTVTSVIYDLPYNELTQLKNLMKISLGTEIIFRPVIETLGCKEKRSLKRIIADFFVGKSTLSLECRRPYDLDENSNIVRISPENMKRLGIEETDQVVITYKDRSFSCKVLSIEDKEEFLKANLYTPIELAIGIPAHIRDENNILDLQSAVKVDRDTWFLLKKSANEQLMPLLFALLSSSILGFTELWQYGLFFIAVAPVIVYINLSTKRNKRTESKRSELKDESEM